MKIGILGTGMVGISLGNKLVSLGHGVKMGSRNPESPKAVEWAAKAGHGASHGTYADAAKFGEVLFNCTQGFGSLESLTSAGAANLAGKVLVDISNPLDFSKGMPPSLFVCNTDSLGEQIQRAFPEARVVKALNTVNADLMVNASLVHGQHSLFICGNDETAKTKVTEILTNEFGWQSVIDLGDITNARATEMLLPIWIRLMMKFGTASFNFQIAR